MKFRHPSFDSLHFLGVILTRAIKFLTPVPFPEATGQAELTEYTEKNNKNSVISAGSACLMKRERKRSWITFYDM